MQKTVLVVRQSEDTECTYHVPPAAWLGELVGCGCGHGIGRHSSEGCRGPYGERCPCEKNPSEILEAAICEARQECEYEIAPHSIAL
jgi:hypothetical protein